MVTRNLTAWQRNPATGRLEWDFDINDYWVVTGSGFGTKDNGFRFNQNFESVAINADISPGLNAAGTGLKLYQGGGSSIDTTMPHSGSKCWHTKFTGNQQTPRVSLEANANYRKLYYSCWWKYRVNSYSGGGDWKLGRMGNTSEPYSASRFDHEYTGTGQPNAHSLNTSVIVGGTTYNPEHAATSKVRAGHTPFFPQPDTWYFYQMIGDSGDYLTNNNYFEVFLNGTSCRYFDGSGTSDPTRAFRNVASPNMLKSILLPLTGIVNATNDIDEWVDEVFVTSDWANAVMTDSPTYGQTLGSGKCVQLVDVTWADGAIIFKPEYGVFNSGDAAYIHILNNSFVVSQSIAVTVP